jgi:hypothetical protein
MSTATGTEPVLIELDEEAWKDHLDNVESWLGNVLMAQASFRQLAEDVRDKVSEPHLKAYLGEVAEVAQRHEQQAEELYRVIGRDPSTARKLGGTALAKARQAWADLFGLAGGAAGPWHDLQQLFLASLNAMGAFGVAEQLGLALGIREIVEITFPISNEKTKYHLLLKELVLETASLAILYKADI